MTERIKIYSADWLLPISRAPLPDGGIAVSETNLIAVGTLEELRSAYPDALYEHFPNSVLLPGLINAHIHLELTAMRGFLETVEHDFFAWLRKLTLARNEKMDADDLFVAALSGALECARAGITCVGDASDNAGASLRALQAAGLRGIVYQETFGIDERLVEENFARLANKIEKHSSLNSATVTVGVSPHSPYTVCAPQLKSVARFARENNLPVMMHAAESLNEELLLLEGAGAFADGLKTRGIAWRAPQISVIEYLEQSEILAAKPLLAHCIRVSDADIQLIKNYDAAIAHCPKSNAKLNHGRAPLAKFWNADARVGLGSDSVASNNLADMLEEARFAALLSRAAGDNLKDGKPIGAREALELATLGGARALRLEHKIGSLEAGKQADFIIVNLNDTRHLPLYDAVGALIFSATGRDVSLTAVAGREIYRDGMLLTTDEVEIKQRLNATAAKLQAS